MRYVPHEYQEYAKEFIIREKVGALFLDCGLGKTVITLTAVRELLFDYFDIRKVLVIAPLRVARDTWGGELEKWEHLSGIGLSKVLGPEKERLAALEREAQVYVINRENVEWLVDSCRWDFDMVVIDELSSFKSHRAKRFKALKKVRPKVRRIVGLTGTPAPNGLIDLWAEIGLLDMGQRLGRFIGGYRERFFLPDKRSRQMVFSYKPRGGAEEAIYGLISDICISMRACDYLDMPECVYNRVEVAMSGREMELYGKLEKDMLLPFAEGDIDAVNAERYVFLPFFWIPEENMVRRVRRDHVPYDVWEKQGFLETTEGDVIHYGFIESFIEDLGKRFHIKEIAFDRWGAVQMVQNLEGLGFTVVPFGQGFKDMSPPTKRLMELVLERNVAHGGHPVLRWMMDNIFVRTDPAGNIKPDKEKSTEKIDGAVAAVMALDRAVRNGGSIGSVYDERGILSF